MLEKGRQDRSGILVIGSMVVLILLVLLALTANYLPVEDPEYQDLSRNLRPPNPENWFGTDRLGRDIFSRIIWGARLTLVSGILPVVIALAVGSALGTISGYLGGTFDLVISRSSDIVLSLPYFLIALVIVAVLGPGLVNAILAVSIGFLPSFIRLARASTLSVKQETYVRSAYAMGMGSTRIMFIHIFPNVVSSVIVFSTIKIGESILAVASLSFLGLGAQPPSPEWGLMLTDARDLVLSTPLVVLFPSVALSITVIAFNLLADEMRDRLDPRYRYL